MKLKVNSRRKKESGFSLLEYCAGAAVIMVTIWAALNLMGQNVSGLLGAIGDWATSRATEISGSGGQGSGSSTQQ